jgi:hypothetical protein
MTRMSFHFPRVTFSILSTRLASGGKQKQRMALVVVCRTFKFSPILTLVCSYCCAVIPSNYVRIVDRKQVAESSNVQTVERNQPARSSNVSDLREPPFKARALYACTSSQSPFLRMIMLFLTITAADTADPDDPNEISLSKGEILDIIDNSGKWWQARKEDGTSGSTESLHSPSQRLF